MKKLIALVAALVMVAGTAYAADWSFYGSSRVLTQYVEVDNPTGINGGVDTEDFDLDLQGNSRIGANVKVSDELTGRFEFGVSNSTVNTRIIWGEWNFGAGSFGVGQHYSPLNMFYSNSVYSGDFDMLPFGGVYSGREPMLQLKFGGFKIAAVEASVQGSTSTTTETSLPAIEASYSHTFGPVALAVAGGYQTYETLVGGVGYDIDSYVIAVGANANFGMFYLKGDLYFGENADGLIWVDYSNAQNTANTTASVSGGTVLDVENVGFILVAGAKFNDMFSAEIGYGYAEADKDNVTQDDEVSTFYAQGTVTLAPGVFFVPEIGVVDYEESDQQEITYVAVKWQINF